MEKQILTLLLVFGFGAAHSQDDGVAVKGLLRTRGTFASGAFLNPVEDTAPIYIQGDLEYYVSPRFSVRSDTYYFIRQANGLDMNHQMFTGIMWHPREGKSLDPWLGFQPGISLNASYHPVLLAEAPGTGPTRFNPLVGISSGFHYFAPKFFHLSVGLSYIHGMHQDQHVRMSLDEIRVSFGLGIHLNVLKKRAG